jgi:hypothetical protein
MVNVNRKVQFRALDEMPQEIREALNYSNIGFSPQDILYLHALYMTGKNTSEEIVDMIRGKDAFVTLSNYLAKSR